LFDHNEDFLNNFELVYCNFVKNKKGIPSSENVKDLINKENTTKMINATTFVKLENKNKSKIQSKNTSEK